MYSTADVITAALSGVLVILLVAIAVRAWLRSRVTPGEKERRRRTMLLASGKMGDANLLDLHDGVVVYSYAVRGVEYTASQDISALQQYLPATFAPAGNIAVRYDPRNPANSIVLAEDWTGLRA